MREKKGIGINVSEREEGVGMNVSEREKGVGMNECLMVPQHENYIG